MLFYHSSIAKGHQVPTRRLAKWPFPGTAWRQKEDAVHSNLDGINSSLTLDVMAGQTYEFITGCLFSKYRGQKTEHFCKMLPLPYSESHRLMRETIGPGRQVKFWRSNRESDILLGCQSVTSLFLFISELRCFLGVNYHQISERDHQI